MKDEALALALEALGEIEWSNNSQWQSDRAKVAITAIKQASSAPVQENAMIYKTFEQWKSGNVLEHGVPRTEHYSEDQFDLVEMGWNYGYDAGRAVEQALDKKAENARELGLDYEPVWDNLPSNKDVEDAMQMKRLNQLATPPAAQRQWVGLTHEEIEKACVPLGAAMLSFTEVARAIEAKLKEKNT
jgi:hypothetical protein